jgi:FKBP-type peptidyl-prolyl cis-trans isomerase
MIKFWTWLKANWWVPFASVVVIISYFAGNSGKQGLKDMLQAQRDDYETQLKVLREQREKEKKILENYKKSLQLLQERYKVKEKEIKKANRQELKKTIEENKDKPVEEIADDFAKRFGLERI